MRERSRKYASRKGVRRLTTSRSRGRPPTIVDIARAAGVSRTTASAALGGSGRVSEATRERVRAVAEQLQYVANPSARHLQAGRTGAIGVYVSETLFGFGFYMEFVFGAAIAARREAFALTVMSSSGASPLTAGHVDGVIVVDPVVGDPNVRELVESGVPVVAAERCLDPGLTPRVTIETDYQRAQRELLDHLAERGARRPALIGLDMDISVAHRLDALYRRWCDEQHVEPRVRKVPLGSAPQAVHDEIRALLADPAPPDAILAAGDGIALAVQAAARGAGRTVGVDLLTASSIDSEPLRLVTPSITAIEAPPREIGGDAARVMLDVLRGEDVPPEILRPTPTIALRESTATTLALAV
jgi:DNA-binding LacI/PurR family transcriptional regulator